MNTENLNPKSQKILILDDELEITKALVRQFKRQYTVFSATNTEDAFSILENEDIQVIISDQRMPGMTGVEFFTNIKTNYPYIIKLILTGYSDIEAVIAAINQGQVFRYITKPWNPDELDSIINEAFEKYELLAANRELVLNLTDANINLEKNVSDRTKKLEQQYGLLEESEERFQLLFNKAPLGYQSLDIDGHFIEINQQWLDTLGYERDEVVGKWFGDFLTPMYQEGFRKRFPIFKAQGHIHSEFEMVHKNGSILFIAFDGRIGNDTDGNFKQTHCILQDITESRRINEALKKSEEQHRTILQTAMDGYWKIDISGHILDVNDTYCQMSGFSRDELLTMSVADLEVIENDTEIALRMKKVMVDVEGRFEAHHRTKNAKEYDVEISVKYQSIDNGFFVLFIRDITEQKMAKNALLDAEWKFKALFELGPIGVAYHRMIYDEAGKPFDYYFIDANASYNELTGVSPKGMNVRQAFPGIENDPSDWIGMFGHVAKTGETIRFEQFLESNGRWYDCVGYQYKPDHFVAAFNEITKRKQAEIAVKTSEEKFRNFFENSVVGKSITAIDGKLNVNNAFCQIVGYSNAELENLNWKEITHKDDIELNINILDSILKGEKHSERWEKRYIHKDGSIVWTDISTTLQRNDEGNPLYFITAVIDISERKNAELALEEKEREYHNLIEFSPVAMSIVHDWKTVYFNPAAIQLFGANKQDELLDKHIFELIHPDYQALASENAKMLAERGYVNMQEQKYIKLDGTVLDVETQAKSIRFNDGPATLVVINDITERKKAEETLKNSQKLLAETEKIGKVGGWEFNMDTFEQIWTEETYNIHEVPYSFEATVEKGINFYTPESLPIIQNAVKLAVEQGVPFDLELDIITAKGNRRNVHTIGHVDLENRRVFGFFQDITERKVAENGLQKAKEEAERSEIYLNNIINSIGDPVFVKDDQSKLLLVNDAFCEIFGLTREVVMGKTLAENVAPDERETFLRIDKQVLDDGQENVNEESLTIQGNETRIISTKKTRFIDNNQTKYLIGIIRDITDSKKASLNLQLSEENFRAIFESNSSAIAIIEPDTTISLVNEAYCKLSGYQPTDVIGKSWTEQIPPADLERLKEYNRLRFLNPKDAPEKYEFTFYRKDGDIRNALMSVSLIEDRKKIITSFIDITDRKKAEEQISMQLQELQRWYDVTLDREGRVLELKREVNELLKKYGEALRYESTEQDNSDIH